MRAVSVLGGGFSPPPCRCLALEGGGSSVPVGRERGREQGAGSCGGAASAVAGDRTALGGGWGRTGRRRRCTGDGRRGSATVGGARAAGGWPVRLPGPRVACACFPGRRVRRRGRWGRPEACACSEDASAGGAGPYGCVRARRGRFHRRGRWCPGRTAACALGAAASTGGAGGARAGGCVCPEPGRRGGWWVRPEGRVRLLRGDAPQNGAGAAPAARGTAPVLAASVAVRSAHLARLAGLPDAPRQLRRDRRRTARR
ncbi:UNVERIFIED_CONTAM: hypothetical protein RKD43_003975 [Streptomyces graminofaciens]